MSLINDALKRAKQAQQQKPPPVPSQQFRPVETTPRRSNLFFLLPVVIVFLSAIGGVLVWVALQKSGTIKHDAPAAQPSKPAAEHVAAVADANPATPTVKPEPVQRIETSAPEKSATAQSQIGIAPSKQGTKPAAIETKAAILPTLKGIFYNPGKPSAVLDSKSVFVGDIVSGFRVLAIGRNTVTITGAGQTNVLTLEE